MIGRRPAAAIVVAALGLAGCGSSDQPTDDGHDSSHGHGSHHEEPDSEDSSGSSGDPIGLAVPDDSAWSAAGFACESFDSANYDDQSVDVCISANEQVASMVRMAIKNDRVIGWSFTGLPTVFPVDVSAGHQASVTTVFGLLNPDDAALAPEIDSAATASGAEWTYERAKKQLPEGGYSAYDLTATSVALQDSGGSTDVLPKPDSFQLDLEQISSAVNDGGTADCSAAGGADLTCDADDYVVTFTTDPDADDQLLRLSFTSFSSADQYAAQGAGFVELLKQSGSDELSSLADQLAQQWSTGGPKWVWMEGLPVLIIPMDSPWVFSVESSLVPAI